MQIASIPVKGLHMGLYVAPALRETDTGASLGVEAVSVCETVKGIRWRVTDQDT